MSVEIARRWERESGLKIHEGYGLTETSPCACYNHPKKYKFGSIGTPINNVEMKIVDGDGKEVAPGRLGEIVVRGPNVMLAQTSVSLAPLNFSRSLATANQEAIAQCAKWISENSCGIWIGFGARQDARVIRQLAEKTGAAVMCSPRAKGIFPENHPQFVGVTDKNDTLSFLSGDGAGAFVVSSLEGDRGLLGTQIINTASTCETFYNELTADETGNPQIFIRARKGAGKILAETAVPLVQECCQKAVKAAGITLDEIDFFAFNTPTAWYTNVCTRALGIDRDRTLNLNPRYANIGPMLPVANLYHGAESGKIRENDLVLVYSIGSVSNAAASVMRWGKVALGPAPAPPITSAAQLDPSLETARV